MAEMVIVVDTDKPVLTFHLWGNPTFVRRDLPDGWFQTVSLTACGMRLHRLEWKNVPAPEFTETRVNDERQVTALRREHADRIGKLYERCAAACR